MTVRENTARALANAFVADDPIEPHLHQATNRPVPYTQHHLRQRGLEGVHQDCLTMAMIFDGNAHIDEAVAAGKYREAFDLTLSVRMMIEALSRNVPLITYLPILPTVGLMGTVKEAVL